MADKLTPERRSANMARIRAKDTKPEMIVRRLLHGMGLRYRLHAKELPGKPDIVFRPRKIAIFVHGCYWHGHGCGMSHTPKSNEGYWRPKLARNRERDAAHAAALEAMGWKVITIWECETREAEYLVDRFRTELQTES